MGQITITWMDGELFEFNPNLLTINPRYCEHKKIHPHPMNRQNGHERTNEK
jgi:hypothetical protein